MVNRRNERWKQKTVLLFEMLLFRLLVESDKALHSLSYKQVSGAIIFH